MWDVSPGDCAVHIQQFPASACSAAWWRLPTGDYVAEELGILEPTRGGVGGDLEYLGDRLFVPIYQVDRLSRYMGEATPSRRSTGWGRRSGPASRPGRAVEDIAESSARVYAARQVVLGRCCLAARSGGRDPSIQPCRHRRLLSMGHGNPRCQYGRLVTGDVGYGKTEFALRAAFKAVSGAQVAVLVPTTVPRSSTTRPSKSGWRPFLWRSKCLSRFRSHREGWDILDRLADGRVDIVIRHAPAIQKDVRFKNLGLLAIGTEEQRFVLRTKSG